MFLSIWIEYGASRPNTEKKIAQKIKFSIKDFFSKCDQIRRELWIWSHLLKKSLMENFILCAVRRIQEPMFFC